MSKFRAIVFDPSLNEAEVMYIDPGLAALYECIGAGCQYVEAVLVGGCGQTGFSIDMWIDEEGFLQEHPHPKGYFRLGQFPQPFAGRAVFVASNTSGGRESLPDWMTPELVKSQATPVEVTPEEIERIITPTITTL